MSIDRFERPEQVPSVTFEHIAENIEMVVERLAAPHVESHAVVVVDAELRPLAAVIDYPTLVRLFEDRAK